MTDRQLAMLQSLATTLEYAKAAERRSREFRVDVEQWIAELIPPAETDSQTVTLPDGTKIVVTRGLTYKADTEAIKKLESPDCPMPLRYETTCKLELGTYEHYRKSKPAVFAQIAEHVEVKPRKVAVAIKETKT